MLMEEIFPEVAGAKASVRDRLLDEFARMQISSQEATTRDVDVGSAKSISSSLDRATFDKGLLL